MCLAIRATFLRSSQRTSLAVPLERPPISSRLEESELVMTVIMLSVTSLRLAKYSPSRCSQRSSVQHHSHPGLPLVRSQWISPRLKRLPRRAAKRILSSTKSVSSDKMVGIRASTRTRQRRSMASDFATLTPAWSEMDRAWP